MSHYVLVVPTDGVLVVPIDGVLVVPIDGVLVVPIDGVLVVDSFHSFILTVILLPPDVCSICAVSP